LSYCHCPFMVRNHHNDKVAIAFTHHPCPLGRNWSRLAECNAALPMILLKLAIGLGD
jgi:hypothetical protein